MENSANPEVPVNVINLPSTIWEYQIFPFLQSRELLRLRLVSKELHELVNSSIRRGLYRNVDAIFINQSDATRNLGSLLSSNLLSSKLHYCSSKSVKLCCDELHAFGRRLGNIITQLHLAELSLPVSEKEHRFLAELPNVTSLQIGNVFWKEEEQCQMRRNYLPDFVWTLRKLVIDTITAENAAEVAQLFDWILEMTREVVHLTLPRLSLGPPFYTHAFTFLENVLSRQQQNGAVTLSTIDLRQYAKYYVGDMEPETLGPTVVLQELDAIRQQNSAAFLRTMSLLHLHGILLQNVSASLVTFSNQVDMDLAQTLISNHIESIIDPDHRVFSFRHSDSVLEVRIRRTRFCAVLPATNVETRFPQNMHLLEIHIDSLGPSSPFQPGNDITEVVTTWAILDYFFNNVTWRFMSKLVLSWCPSFIEACRFAQVKLPSPVPTRLIKSCGTLSSLSLTNWQGKDSDLQCLLTGLPALSHLTLDGCPNLSTSGFFADENLETTLGTGIRILKLQGLEKSPGLDDTLLFEWIRYRPLIEFFMSSNGPLNTITTHGIRGLLYFGVFMETISRFPLTNIQLSGVSREELDQLEAAFRSRHL